MSLLQTIKSVLQHYRTNSNMWQHNRNVFSSQLNVQTESQQPQ